MAHQNIDPSSISSDKLNNAFWQFSLSVYAFPAVESLCLTLQNDYHLDVNELLFSVWLATQHDSLDMSTLQNNQQLQHLKKKIVPPLRQARVNMGNVDKQHPIYQQLKDVEIQCEQEIQAILWSIGTAQQHTPVHHQSKNIPTLLEKNIQALWRVSSNAGEKTQPATLIQFSEWMIAYVTGKI